MRVVRTSHYSLLVSGSFLQTLHILPGGGGGGFCMLSWLARLCLRTSVGCALRVEGTLEIPRQYYTNQSKSKINIHCRVSA